MLRNARDPLETTYFAVGSLRVRFDELQGAFSGPVRRSRNAHGIAVHECPGLGDAPGTRIIPVVNRQAVSRKLAPANNVVFRRQRRSTHELTPLALDRMAE